MQRSVPADNELNHISNALAVIGSVLIAAVIVILGAVFSSKAHAAEDPAMQIAILYAESASDPEGWLPKLNTYHKARRSGESLTQTMKRVSSAYRTRSRQYRKAISGDLNAYEKKVYARIQAVVLGFKADPSWKYVYHENLRLYRSKEEAFRHLRKAWGNRVDFAGAVQMGREHYFAEV